MKLTGLLYDYDSVEELRLHKDYMLKQGAKIFDESEEYLFVEYTVNIEEFLPEAAVYH